jgi:TRAP-type C4-dicarboxylate transport system permease small subunit
MDSLRAKLPQRAGRVFDFFIEILWIWFAVALIWLSYRVAMVAKLQESPGLEIPMSYPYYAMVAGGAYPNSLLSTTISRYAP